MSVDTRQKRSSAITFGRVPAITLPEADGSVDADDMAQLLMMYSGIVEGAPVAATSVKYRGFLKSVGRLMK